MANYPGQKWKLKAEKAEKIKEFLISKGGVETEDIKSEHELWRIRYSNTTFTYYKSGTLFSTGTKDQPAVNACRFIESLGGPRFKASAKKILIGMDEAGKGEIIGDTVLCAAALPLASYDEIEAVVGVADTKKKHIMSYWDKLSSRLNGFKKRGLRFCIAKIPPGDVDKFNLNKLMDDAYERILSELTHDVGLKNCRIVLDDYGAGRKLEDFLNVCKLSGAEVVITSAADDNYLEAKAASVIAKRERESIIERINESEEFIIDGKKAGSGNAGDPATIQWLKAWKKSGKEWPWFVKKSFKTVRDLDGIKGKQMKTNPHMKKEDRK